MAKVILLVRVSTFKQEIETQTQELVDYAIADGWKQRDLIIIEGVGASAIKLNDIYLQEMEQLYKTIEENEIGAVYAWEISRIGRNEEILMKFKNFLINHNVQLVIKNPSLRLLNADGSVNKGVELAFSLFATMSKQEMELKQERFRRAKERNKAEGKYNGGRIKLGYRLDKNKYFIIDEEKAQVVRNIFEWFVNDGLTQTKIHDRLLDMGIFKGKDLFTYRGKRIGVILRDKAYIGEGNYPQIVSNEIFEQANEKMANRHKWHTSKNIFFCKGLIKDTTTGATLVARSATLVYQLRHVTHCIALNINVMDYIAQYSANILMAHYNSVKAQTNRNEYKLKLEENKNIIAAKQAQIKEHEKAIERAINMNIKQPKYFPTEKMEQVIKQNETIIDKLNETITDLQTENTRMNNWLNGNQQFINTIKGVSDEKKQEMIHQVIDRIEITKLEQHHFQIVIKNKIGVICDSWFDYTCKGNKLHVEQIFTDGRAFDITPQINANKRFQRIRYNGK